MPILVAINKIDKPDANAERVKKELADLGLVPEAWGGDHGHGRGVGEEEAEPRRAARNDSARHRDERAQGEPQAQRVGHGARGQARQGSRPGGDDPGAGRNAQHRRHVDRRDDRRQGPRAHRRSRPSAEARRTGDAGRSPRPRRPALAGRRLPGARRRDQGAADRALPPDPGQGKGARREGLAPHARIPAGRRLPKAA